MPLPYHSPARDRSGLRGGDRRGGGGIEVLVLRQRQPLGLRSQPGADEAEDVDEDDDGGGHGEAELLAEEPDGEGGGGGEDAGGVVGEAAAGGPQPGREELGEVDGEARERHEGAEAHDRRQDEGGSGRVRAGLGDAPE